MVEFVRIKGLTQNGIATKAAAKASELVAAGYKIISITQYADAESIGRNKAATIYYTR